MTADSSSIIVADTNIAYILYFFIDKAIIPWSSISININSLIKFHPIVLLEVHSHKEAWDLCQAYSYSSPIYPDFFDLIRGEGIQKVIEFVESNIEKQIPSVDIDSREFHNKRKTYEAERHRLQLAWKNSGVLGNKTTSKPSNNDYSVLFSAEKYGLKLVTNDEILLSIAQEFLAEENTYKAEDIINARYKENPNLRELIEDASEVLNNLKITFNISRALK